MKKYRVLLGFILISMSLLLQGCSNTKTLECDFIDNAGFLEKQILEYKNDKLYSYEIIYSYDFNYLDENIDNNELNICDSIMEDESVMSCVQKTDDKTFKVETKLDINKANKDILKQLNDIKKTKETFENNSKATCEIK